jgi:hypothetical protein
LQQRRAQQPVAGGVAIVQTRAPGRGHVRAHRRSSPIAPRLARRPATAARGRHAATSPTTGAGWAGHVQCASGNSPGLSGNAGLPGLNLPPRAGGATPPSGAPAGHGRARR